jgi:sugar phosphate isomerase/epimerase
VRFGGSTYGKLPFRPQFDDLVEVGFDYVELDLSFTPKTTPSFAEEARRLAAVLPIRSAHLPRVAFSQTDLIRCVGFLDALAPLGCDAFNVHLHSPSLPKDRIEKKQEWLAQLADAARLRDCYITVENLDEDVGDFRPVFDAVSDLRFCLDIGHAHLGGRKGRAEAFLEAFGPRLGLVHVHDNRGGRGKAGDLHLPLGQGTIDLPPVVAALRRTGYDGLATFEIFRGTKDDKKASLDAFRRRWAGE